MRVRTATTSSYASTAAAASPRWPAASISTALALMATPPSRAQNSRSARASVVTSSPRASRICSRSGSSSARGIGGGLSAATSVSAIASSHRPSTSYTHASCQRASNAYGANGVPAATPRSMVLRNQCSVSSNSAQSS